MASTGDRRVNADGSVDEYKSNGKGGQGSWVNVKPAGSETPPAGSGSSGGNNFEYPGLEIPEVNLAQTTDDILAAQPKLTNAQLAEQARVIPAQSALFAAQQAKQVPVILQNQLDIMRQYQPQILGLQTDLAAQERGATLNNIEALTPQVNKISRDAMGPQNQGIFDELQKQTAEGLNAGTQLTAREQRDVQQGARSADASRGIVGGSGSSNREAVEMSLAGSERQQQRQGQASSFLALDQSLRANPFTAVGGMATPGTSTSTNLVLSPGISTPTAGASINGQSTALTALGANTQQNQLALQGATAELGAQQDALAYNLQREQTAKQLGYYPDTGLPYAGAGGTKR